MSKIKEKQNNVKEIEHTVKKKVTTDLHTHREKESDSGRERLIQAHTPVYVHTIMYIITFTCDH